MKIFEQAGETMLLAHQGNVQIGKAIVATLRAWRDGVTAWLRNMPTTLPPTESVRR